MVGWCSVLFGWGMFQFILVWGQYLWSSGSALDSWIVCWKLDSNPCQKCISFISGPHLLSLLWVEEPRLWKHGKYKWYRAYSSHHLHGACPILLSFCVQSHVNTCPKVITLDSCVELCQSLVMNFSNHCILVEVTFSGYRLFRVVTMLI